MQSDRQERISERAYHIWVAEGRVEGHHEDHWHRAEREIAEEERRLAAALVDRATGTSRKGAKPAGAKAAGAKAAGAKAAGKSRATAAPRPRRTRSTAAGPSSS